MTNSEMRRSWLVQRLEKPRNYGQLKDNPFSFGGGLRNGGLTGDAMDLLRPIFSFDYMGAAEFEFGAVPKALQSMAEAARSGKRKKPGLIADWFQVDLETVQPNWRNRDAKPPKGAAAVYLIARPDHFAEAAERIRGWAAEDADLKEFTQLPRTLWPQEKWDGDVQGWLELDNGFMFFTDADMFGKTAEVFGIDATAVIEAARESEAAQVSA